MHENKYEAAKKEIRSVLLTYKDLVPLNEFLKTYKNLLGQKLPSRDLGFSTDVDFLSSMPDVVDVKSDPDGKVYLSGIADKASGHIQKLVSRQRRAKPNNSKAGKHNARQPLRKWPTSLPTARELKPFLPDTLRAEFIELMNSNHSLTLPSFVLAYHQKFGKLLNYPGGLKAIEAMIKLIPELEVVKENNETVIYNRRFLKSPQSVKESIRKNKSPSGMTIDNVVQEKNAFSIHESGISEDTLKEFQMVLEKFPDGIMNIHFPPLYEEITGKPFDVAELGYNCVADLVEILPHIFKRVSNPHDERHWLIYPAESHIIDNYEDKQIIDNFSRKELHHAKELEKMANGSMVNGLINSSTINEDFLQSDNSDMSVSESPINRKLSFSTDVQNNGAQSNAPDFHIEKHSRRYVKEIEVCEGSKIHLINLEKKLFMSCGELCSLLWSQKDANFLIRRLKDKEIDIPFHHVNKEDCVELFKQCLWYKIRDFEKKDSDCSSLILCPLEKAFDILNIFGHPSICLRIIMQNEMRTFDPDDEFWNEISYQELLELNGVENNILREINKLCLFDLKAKHEAFQIQKLKQLRHHSNSSTEEIQRIQNIINIITRRIKQIESICAQCSSCS